MDPDEARRRPSVKIHLALLAALGLYGLLFVQTRSRMVASASIPEERRDFFLPMLALGVVQYGVVSVSPGGAFGRPSGRPATRARASFLLRAVSAEVLALFGLMIDFRGSPVAEVAALFALSLAAMLGSFPTREAWQNAVRAGQTGSP